MTAVAVLLLWLAVAYRLYMVRRSSGSINISYSVAAICIAAAFTVKVAEAGVDTVTGPYVSDLIEHGLVVVGGGSAQLFLLALRTGRLDRRTAAIRVSIAAGVLVAMALTFTLAPVHHGVTGDLDEVYGHLGSIALYRLVFNAYLTYVLVDNIRLCRRYAAIPGDLARSVSLNLVGWGSAVALVYSSSRIVYFLASLALDDQPAVITTVGSAGASVGLCGLAAGMLAPRIVPGLTSWMDALRGIRRVGALWRDLIDAFPLIALPTGLPTTVRRAELRYDRRLVEVSEALAQVRVLADELPSDDVDPVRGLARALRSSRGRWTAGHGVAAVSLLPEAREVADERRQILALADAYHQTPNRADAPEGARA